MYCGRRESFRGAKVVPMRVISVVGARPQFIKLAALDWELKASGHEHLILHTGQHYDEAMSGAFFEELSIQPPAWNLEVGSGLHGAQTAQMLDGCERVFLESDPDWVLCYGDTNSTCAAAIGAVKLRVRLAHIEAGLRSFNRTMPEEHNRVVADHLSDVLFAPTHEAMHQLEREGLSGRSVLVGDVMADVVRNVKRKIGPESAGSGDFIATVHRAENTDQRDRLESIVDALASLPSPVVLFAHPRLVQRAEEHGIELRRGSIRVEAPTSHLGIMSAIAAGRGVVTDSGGLQKEAFLMERPCTTVRKETEWPETLLDGWNVLVEPDKLAEVALRPNPTTKPNPDSFGDGHAAARIVQSLENFTD